MNFFTGIDVVEEKNKELKNKSEEDVQNDTERGKRLENTEEIVGILHTIQHPFNWSPGKNREREYSKSGIMRNHG